MDLPTDNNYLLASIQSLLRPAHFPGGGGGGVLPILAYKSRLRPKEYLLKTSGI